MTDALPDVEALRALLGDAERAAFETRNDWELRACPNPWCASHREPVVPFTEDDVWQLDGRHRVQCPDCPIRGPHADSEADAIARWNDRPPAIREAVEGEQWQDIATAPRDGVTRMNLCWQASGGLDAHVELGKWSASNGWVNTYGQPFSGDPDFYQLLPDPPIRTPVADIGGAFIEPFQEEQAGERARDGG